MKPKTKKTLIIILAVVAVLVIVWYLFSWRKSPNGIVSRLDLSKIDLKDDTDSNIRKRIRAQVGAVKQMYTREEIIHQAESDGLTYNQELVDWACFLLKKMDYFNESAYVKLSQQIRNL